MSVRPGPRDLPRKARLLGPSPRRIGHTVEIALFTIEDRPLERRRPGRPPKELQVLLVRREKEPWAGWWALPTAPVGVRESLQDAAFWALGRRAGLKGPIYLEQLRTYDDPHRNPIRRVIATAYMGLVAPTDKGEPGAEAAWFPVDQLPPPAIPGADRRFALDHDQILSDALQRLRNKVDYTLLAFSLLPEEFTMTELRQVYEAILDEDLGTYDERRKANFQRSIHLLNERVGRMMEARTGRFQPPLVKTGNKRKAARGPAADLYRFQGDITLITK